MNKIMNDRCSPTFTSQRMNKIKPSNFKIGTVLQTEKNQSSKFSKIKEGLKKYIKDYPKAIRYTSKHKKAFLEVEKILTGKNSLNGYLHDFDKLIMYIIGIPHEVAHNIHVATAPHHVRKGKVNNPLMAVIDWECARYTKPDKPLSARDFYENYYVKKQNIRIPEIEEKLTELGLQYFSKKVIKYLIFDYLFLYKIERFL